MTRGSRLAVAALTALMTAVPLAGCGSTGAGGASIVTTATTPVPVTTPTIAPDALDALVAARTKEFAKASRKFRKCDKNVVTDSFSPSPCLDQSAAETGVVAALLADLESVVTPADFASKKADLRGLIKAGNRVAAKCARQNDQTCDQALAVFRAADQTVVWALDANV